MTMHVTDAACLENDETLLKEMTVLSSEEERARLKVNAGKYVETVLNYNPDATEQIDTQDKHLACADALGTQAREKTLVLFKEQNETCTLLAQSFLPPYPTWIKEFLSGLDRMAARLSPGSHRLSLNKPSLITKHYPLLSPSVRNYIKTIHHAREDCKRLVDSLDHAILRFERILTELVQQSEDIKTLSRSLYHAIEFGHVVELSLAQAVKKIPGDDPRIGFIEDTLIERFRTRINLLRFQMILNRESLITQEIHIRNCREMKEGLEKSKSLVLQAFNLAVMYCRTVTGRKMIRRIWPDTYEEIKTMVLPENREAQFTKMEQAFSDVSASGAEMKSFLSETGPALKASLESKMAHEQKTEKKFKHMQQFFKHILQQNLSELE